MSRLRAVLDFSAPRAVLGILLLVPAVLAQIGLARVLGQGSFLVQAAPQIASMLLALAGYWVLRRFVEREAPAELRGHTPQLFAGGAVIGAALMCATMAAIAVTAALTLTPGAGWRAFLSGVLVFLNAAIFEELLFRGIVFRLTDRSLGSLAATAVSALVFGGAHFLNPNATWLSAMAIAVEAGILLAAAYLVFRSLWFAIGLHFGWDWFESSVFGATESGVRSSGLLHSTFVGPDWLTGGAFGPEGSVPAVVMCTCAGAILLAVAWRHGQWRSLAKARQLLAERRVAAG